MDMPTSSGQSSPAAAADMNYMEAMKTYFHWDHKLQLLFRGWHSESTVVYALSLAAIFIMALFHEWFGELKTRLMNLSPPPPPPPPPAKAAQSTAAAANIAVSSLNGELPRISSSSSLSAASSAAAAAASSIALRFANFKQSLSSLLYTRPIRLLLLTLTHVSGAACGFLLMLAIMSYNLGVFLSVLAGLASGFILFQTQHFS